VIENVTMFNSKPFIDRHFNYNNDIVIFGTKDKRSKNLRCKKYAKNNRTAVGTWAITYFRNLNKS